MDSRHRDGFEREHHAEVFEQRAGLPPQVVRQVAERVRALCPAGLLEVGAGTGEIGAHLARSYGARGYVALDRSAAMLAQFRMRAPAAALLIADASAPWPFARASFDAVWMARVAHLLDRDQLAAELVRVVRPGGAVLIGRRQRERDNVRAVLRRRLHQLLVERGYTPRAGGREARLLGQLGPELVHAERLEVASWEVAECAEEALASWHDKPGLSGIDLDERDKAEVLAALREFARAELGPDLRRAHAGREHFVIDVLRRAASGDCVRPES